MPDEPSNDSSDDETFDKQLLDTEKRGITLGDTDEKSKEHANSADDE